MTAIDSLLLARDMIVSLDEYYSTFIAENSMPDSDVAKLAFYTAALGVVTKEPVEDLIVQRRMETHIQLIINHAKIAIALKTGIEL